MWVAFDSEDEEEGQDTFVQVVVFPFPYSRYEYVDMPCPT